MNSKNAVGRSRQRFCYFLPFLIDFVKIERKIYDVARWIWGLYMDKAKLEEWYDCNLSANEQFKNKMESLIQELISEEGIHVHSITSRVKEKDSFFKKCELKNYERVDKVTDIVGIRIITHILEDVKKVRELIEAEFEIDSDNSGDKSSDLKPNETGYLSDHRIAQLNSSRSGLSEYKQHKGKVFEIQIRTLLQHAWAEISHENSYKFSGVLPEKISRHFYLTAGTLELIDQEFQRLIVELSGYSNKVKEHIKAGIFDIEINSFSLNEYLSEKLKDFSEIEHTLDGGDKEVIDVLEEFGVKTIRELDDITSPSPENNFREMPLAKNYLDFLRDIMKLKNEERYLDIIHRRRKHQRPPEELSEHKDIMSQKIKEGNLQIKINTASLSEYLLETLKEFNQVRHIFGGYKKEEEIIQELKDFGVNTLESLDVIVSPLLKSKLRAMPLGKNNLGFLRYIMLLTDEEKYFGKCWKQNWKSWSKETYDFMKQFIDVDSIVEKHGIKLRLSSIEI